MHQKELSLFLVICLRIGLISGQAYKVSLAELAKQKTPLCLSPPRPSDGLLCNSNFTMALCQCLPGYALSTGGTGSLMVACEYDKDVGNVGWKLVPNGLPNEQVEQIEHALQRGQHQRKRVGRVALCVVASTTEKTTAKATTTGGTTPKHQSTAEPTTTATKTTTATTTTTTTTSTPSTTPTTTTTGAEVAAADEGENAQDEGQKSANEIPEEFLGKWTLHHSRNFEQYLNRRFSIFTQRLARIGMSNKSILKRADGAYNWDGLYTGMQLGKEFTCASVNCLFQSKRILFTYSPTDQTLTETHTANGQPILTYRYTVEDDFLVMRMKWDDVSAELFFERTD